MSRCKGAEIKVCNLKWIKQGQKSTIPPFPEEFLMWKWFDKYIVRNPEMDSFSMYSNILEIPRIGRLFGRSKKFRNSKRFREKAQEFFKLTFKVNTFKLKLENNEVQDPLIGQICIQSRGNNYYSQITCSNQSK